MRTILVGLFALALQEPLAAQGLLAVGSWQLAVETTSGQRAAGSGQRAASTPNGQRPTANETAANEVTVFAAASLTDALQEIAANYERETGARVVFNFGASSMLARQIEQGAPADLFASADEAKMDALARQGLIDATSRVSLLSNTLVIVSNIPMARPQELVGVRSIALAEPSSVPAGIYAKQYLTSIGIWDRVENKIVPTDNVRGALAAVKSRNVDAAIVYKTDARNVRDVYLIEIKDGPPISYPFAIVHDATHAQATLRFLAYLATQPAREVFAKHGFLATLPAARRPLPEERTSDQRATGNGERFIASTANGNRPSESAATSGQRAAGSGQRFNVDTANGQRPTANETTSGQRATGSGQRTHDLRILFFTIRVAALATLAILPPGLAVAWLLARKRWRGKSIVETLVAMPLVMPPVATGLILLELFGRTGPIGHSLHAIGVDVVFTWRAVVLAMAVMSFPLLVRAARVAFETVDPRLEQIARTLGAHNVRVFVTITLPLAARGIVAGMLLAFARALGEFGATILVAGNIPGRTSTLSLSIYNLVQLGRDADALHLLVYAVVIAFAAVWLAEAASRRTA